MSRIVAGTAGGRTIAVPPRGTRPTTEKVREALFSRLDHVVGLAGARLLDLYAGSGAVALEAASRGAQAVAVESSRAATRLIARNAADLGLAIDVVTARVASHLAAPPVGASESRPFDIVFADPPYAQPPQETAQALGLLADGPWLAPEATVIVEADRRTPEPAWPKPWPPAVRKDYGETTLWYVHGIGADLRQGH